METNEAGNADYLYRFRSVEKLLEKKELDELAIYFAAPEQLNDPLEGHINVYWEGDEVIWVNLFRHYVNCVMFTFNLYSLFERHQRTITWNDIQVRDPLVAGFHEEHLEIPPLIFEHPIIGQYIQRISRLTRRVGPNELHAHLEAIHGFVVLTIFRWYHERASDGKKYKPIDFERLYNIVDNRVSSAIGVMNDIDDACGGDFQKREARYQEALLLTEEANLLTYYQNLIDIDDKNRAFFHNDFCRTYISKLRTLMYPRWFAACFMEKCDAMSMWAYYGDSHKGVCLKYKTTLDAVGKPSLRINTPVGVSGDFSTVYNYINQQFLPVSYQGTHLAQNFFDTLQSVTQPVLNNQWLRGKNGASSRFGHRDRASQNDWRNAYWQDARVSTSTKTPEWRLEGEHRLVYQTHMGFDLDAQPELRLMQYDFSALDGIIFGIRTPAREKMTIIKIIEEKCKATRRKDFNFYQAVLAHESGKVEYVKLAQVNSVIVEAVESMQSTA